MHTMDLHGVYETKTDSEEIFQAILPGTLDENKIGYPDNCAQKWHPDVDLDSNQELNSGLFLEGVITSRFTRGCTYEGVASFQRSFICPTASNKQLRFFIEVERARQLQLILNGVAIAPFESGTLSTPYLFEITSEIKEQNKLLFLSDNSYPDWPKQAILYSSAASDETQTNWNGLLGYLRLRVENQNFISHIQIYPKGKTICVFIEISAAVACTETLYLESPALKKTYSKTLTLKEGKNSITIADLTLAEHVLPWDEYEGNLYPLHIYGSELEAKTVNFGIRDFKDRGDGTFSLSDHRIFLRCEANCCVFPETGHMPMDLVSWRSILELYKRYGINCVRFHSHCPPEAAFMAADEIGMLIQPELSNWDPKTAFESEESVRYYTQELVSILKTYANHPSFVMLTLGNELHGNAQAVERMHSLIALAKSMDDTRLYAIASNPFYGEKGADSESDFYTSAAFYQNTIRGTSAGMTGHINSTYPNSKTNYNDIFNKIRQEYAKPVFSFEVGQYEVLPDFDEINDFCGVTIPNNLIAIQKNVEKKGFQLNWKQRVAASGELALIAYREEIEAALRTENLSGISLLGLQDFLGQGTALVGMLNAHLKPKPHAFASPERFQKFFSAVLPLLMLERYTYTADETITVSTSIANYGKTSISGPLSYELTDGKTIYYSHTAGDVFCPHSHLTPLGTQCIPLNNITTPQKLILRVCVESFSNEYSIWVYPSQKLEVPNEICIVCSLPEAMIELEKGKRVFLSPMACEESFPSSVKTCFTTDFWSVGTFAFQEGYMGCLIDSKHSLFADFPTEFHSDWQWWILTNARAMVVPSTLHSIVEALDCYARLRALSFLFECQVGNGRLLVSSMGLLQKQQYPEARALLSSIYRYMSSDQFAPRQLLQEVDLSTILH